MATNPKKKALLAKIHIAKKDLCLDDGMYRDILRRVTGKDSSSKMLISELEKVINEFMRLGWKSSNVAKFGRKPRFGEGDNRIPLLNKIEAILADNKLHWNYLKPMVANLGKADVTFLNHEEMFKLVQMLETQENRKSKKPKADTLRQAQGERLKEDNE